MLRRTRAALATALPFACLITLVAAGGCGGSTEKTKDGGTPANDATQPEEGGTPEGDQGTAQPDQGGGDDEFGRACDANSDPCGSPLVCLTVPGQSKGFCTKQCTNQGVPCSGSPPGTVAYCIAKDPVSEKLSCAFVCAHPQLGNQKCPAGLACPAMDNPPGSGQKICGPP